MTGKQDLLERFTVLLRAGDKEGCVNLVIPALDAGTVNVLHVYTNILAPALNTVECSGEDEGRCIWEEHQQTAIVRAIVELCYPTVLREGKIAREKKNKGKAIVLNPPEEHHELGARMVADFFTLAGFDTTFIGANTPVKAVISAVTMVKPGVLAISVVNPYHVFALKKLVASLKTQASCDARMLVVVGGRAFHDRPGLFKDAGADVLVSSFEDILALEVPA